jgi:hypothetical protein
MGLHDSLSVARGEARQKSRRRRCKDADTAPHIKHGPPEDLLGVLGHAPAPPPGSFGSSGSKTARAPGASAAAFAAAPAAAEASAAEVSAAAESAAVTSAALAAASVWAAEIYARSI